MLFSYDNSFYVILLFIILLLGLIAILPSKVLRNFMHSTLSILHLHSSHFSMSLFFICVQVDHESNYCIYVILFKSSLVSTDVLDLHCSHQIILALLLQQHHSISEIKEGRLMQFYLILV